MKKLFIVIIPAFFFCIKFRTYHQEKDNLQDNNDMHRNIEQPRNAFQVAGQEKEVLPEVAEYILEYVIDLYKFSFKDNRKKEKRGKAEAENHRAKNCSDSFPTPGGKK